MLNWASANRDPETFENPDEFRLDRSPNPHVAFGFGIHTCTGAQLAQMNWRSWRANCSSESRTWSWTATRPTITSPVATSPCFPSSALASRRGGGRLSSRARRELEPALRVEVRDLRASSLGIDAVRRN